MNLKLYNQVKIKAANRIKKNGLAGFATYILKTVPLLILFYPVCLLISLIKPFLFIRVGTLHENRIGHFAINNELYLCEKEHGFQCKRSFDFFFHGDHVSNYQLLKMWQRTLNISRFAKFIHFTFTNFSFGKSHIITTTNSDRDVHGLMEKSEVHLRFTKEEKVQALSEMAKMNIGEEDSFVCLLTRDSEYLEKKYPTNNWSYHNHRNCSIQNYVLVTEQMIEKGYHVVRMGSEVKETIKLKTPKYIEYSRSGFRTEMLDIYLTSQCKFFVSCSTGLDSVADIFRIPIVYVNLVPLENITPWSSNSISIFRKYWMKKEKRYMTVSEMISSGAGRISEAEEFEKRGIQVIENTPEEIRDAVMEMDDRLNGEWNSTREEEELQERFWALFKPNDLNKVFRARVGTSFLKKNKYLLQPPEYSKNGPKWI